MLRPPSVTTRRKIPGSPPVAVNAGSELLRIASVGSVDDGKSTLMGRLLHDTKQLFDDQVEAISLATRGRGVDGFDLSYVTDGLRFEREHGITVDVAYRYATTPLRKLVIADCPGHLQYTHNMATGASTADLVVVVIDATTGLREQTRRHCCIAAVLGVRHMLVAVNKMDLVSWDPSAYLAVDREVCALAERLGIEDVTTVPVSALLGDNVASASTRSPWYEGPTILEALERADTGAWATGEGGGWRLPVQWITDAPGSTSGYAGMVSGGTIHAGDEVAVLPAGARTRVASMHIFDRSLQEGAPGLSVTTCLEDDLEVSRGDMLASADTAPEVTSELEATLCWFGPRRVSKDQRFRIKHTTRTTPMRVDGVEARLDISSLDLQDVSSLAGNEVGIARLVLGTPLAVDPYRVNRVTGSFIVIDEGTNYTVAAGMVGAPNFLGTRPCTGRLPSRTSV
jgi:sulfate adenylyltransferase large subunit